MLVVLLYVVGSVDVEASVVSCPTAAMVTAGNEVECSIELKTTAGMLTGDASQLCLFSSNITNTADGLAEAEEYDCTSATLASPFHWTGQTGRYKLLTTPTASGILRGNIIYNVGTSDVPLHEINYYVQPATEDHSKVASSCATNVGGSVECTTLHRDRFGNKIKECFQRWDDNDPVATCTMLARTSTN